MKKTISVNVNNIDDEYKPLVKEEMNFQDLSTLGSIILKHKISKLKNKFKRKKT